MNGRWRELPKAADFRKHSSWAVPSGGHFYFTSAILNFFYVNNFKAASRNSTKLHTSNRWWVMPTTVDFPWATVAPPVGHFYQIFTFFLLIFKTVWPKLTELHIIDREKTQHQPVFEPAGPPQRPLVDIFILDFDFFVLIFKTVWRISMKLHTNDRQRESPYCSWFSKTLAHSSTTWRPFLFFVGHFEICLC